MNSESQQNEPTMNPDQTNKVSASSSQTGGSKSPDGQQPEIESALRDFEGGLHAMRQLFAKRKEMLDDFAQREAALREREAEFADQNAMLAKLRGEVADRESRALFLASDAEQSAQKLAEDRAKHEAMVQELSQQAAALEEMRRSIEAERDQIESQRTSLEAERVALEETRSRFEAMRVDAERMKAEGAAGIAEAKKTAMAEVERVREGLRQEQRAFEARVSQMAEREAALCAMEQSLQARELDCAARIAECTKLKDELEAQRAVWAEQSAAQRRTLEQTAIELAAQQERLNESTAALESEIAAQRASLDAQRQELAQRIQSDGDAAATLRTELETLTQHLRASEERCANQEKRLAFLNEEVARLSDAAANAREELAQMTEQASEQSRRVVSLTRRVAELEDQANASSANASQQATQAQSLFHEQRQAIEAERAIAAELRGRTTELENELSQADAAVQALRERLKVEIAARNQLTEQFRVLNEDYNAARSGGTSATGTLPSRSEDFVARRKRRLKSAHAMLKAEATKVRQAAAAISGRYEQAELVLRQRENLNAIRERVLDAERRATRTRASGRASLVVASVVFTFSTLAALSWGVARQVAPARYTATAVLSAEGRGREINEAELGEWQKTHVAMLKDPRLHEAAAERFRRQGFDTLALPSNVKELIDSGKLATDSTQDGELKLILTDLGSDRTQRTLDTLVASIAGKANADSRRRVDGAATSVTQAAKSGSDPIDNAQTYWALGMLGVASVFVAGVGIGLWKKLSKAKSDFERDVQVHDLLDAKHWAEFNKETAKRAASTDRQAA